MAVTFTRTREQLSDMILRKLGVLGSGTSVSAAASDTTIVIEAIDLWIKQAHRQGIFWRKTVPRAVNMNIPAVRSASAASIADMLFPISMFVTTNSRDEPVQIISYRDYAAISDKSQAGTPTKAMWNGDVSAGFVVWPVPTTTLSAGIIYQAIATDTSAATAIDVDVAMIPHVKDIIAFNLGDEYDISESTMTRWERAATRAEINIRKLNALRVTPSPVAVDDFDGRVPGTRTPTDY